MPHSRRSVLGALAGAAVLAGTGAGNALAAPADAVGRALRRLLPRHAGQVSFRPLPLSSSGRDRFRVTGRRGAILVEGTTPGTRLTGFHTYLREVAGAHFSWNGQQTELPGLLPAVPSEIAREAVVGHRFALNDTNDGYTGAYHDWAYWERELDVLALHGYNAVLLTIGTDAVYHRVLREFGYTEEEARAWVPGPAHQPWWLLQNMSGYGGPVSAGTLAERAALGRRIADRLRELGMTPVLPGFFGTVPVGFGDRNSGAPTVPQGTWCGFSRPDWLDPRSSAFRAVAASFYAHQEALLGSSSMYKMDLLHEGGDPGDVPVGAAAEAVQTALHTARPGAVWAVLGWQSNPRAEILAAVDRSRMLILDGLSDRFPTVTDRESDWQGTPYAFGSIWNFGGHTTMGANTPDWHDLFTKWRTKAGSALDGIALMPEGADNNPAAFALFSDLAWARTAPDLKVWFRDWSLSRYGRRDAHAEAAWEVLRTTAYGTTRADGWSEAQDSLFSARPALDVASAAAWSPQEARYDVRAFEAALPHLLAVAPALRSGPAYRYDLMDVARQTVANRSRTLLPLIRAAFEARDGDTLARLSSQWLDWMDLLEKIVATDRGHLLGRWVADARAWGGTASERDRYAGDAVSLITTWAGRVPADDGQLADYANREWSGLVGGLYRLRWHLFLAELRNALREDRAPAAIDWFAVESDWLADRPALSTSPAGDLEALARKVVARLRR
ncbi:alpha-N-acetylglucosaminidase [Streptomyces sp. NPDC059740]|uniref:alpha-N-acetylglucosaminidase n=1 Tax=Streptomyces sp. NPDC059740 TaxID=3346926 RepID=UPI0036574BED